MDSREMKVGEFYQHKTSDIEIIVKSISDEDLDKGLVNGEIKYSNVGGSPGMKSKFIAKYFK